VFVRCDLSFVGGLCFVVADFVFESSEKKTQSFFSTCCIFVVIF
jgi:hypothetical protein